MVASLYLKLIFYNRIYRRLFRPHWRI